MRFFAALFLLPLATKVLAVGPIASQVSNQIATQSAPDPDSLEKVRIGLRLAPYEKTDANAFQINEKAVLHYTLRASLDRDNHFYINGFHIETKPINRDRKTNAYTTKISISKLFGGKEELEEKLGDVVLRGSLEGSDGVYILQGMTSKQFKNKFKQPILDLAIGTMDASEDAS